jgi:hypothetical protein
MKQNHRKTRQQIKNGLWGELSNEKNKYIFLGLVSLIAAVFFLRTSPQYF